MPAEGMKIVQMQTPARVVSNPPANISAKDLDAFEQLQMESARAQLSLLQAGGYEIVEVTIGGNDQVLLTVWTLKLAPVQVEVDPIVGDDSINGLYPNIKRTLSRSAQEREEQISAIVHEELRRATLKGNYPYQYEDRNIDIGRD